VLRVGAMPAGKEIDVKVWRGSRLVDVKVRLGKYPVHGDVVATTRRPMWNGLRVDYASVGVNASRSPFFSVNMPNRGVLVVEADSATSAQNPELVAGALIVKVNGAAVDDPNAFEAAVRAAQGPVKLTVARMQAGRNGAEWTDAEVVVEPRTSKKKPSAKQANDN
jgi:S1-C subfamily serine protease